MEFVSNSYEDVVLVYIGLVKHDSRQAAAAIEQIYATFGARPALRAALIITVFRMELKQNCWTPDVTVYNCLIQDYPEVLPLLEYAIGCSLQAWGIRDQEFVRLKMSHPTHSNAQTDSVVPYDE